MQLLLMILGTYETFTINKEVLRLYARAALLIHAISTIPRVRPDGMSIFSGKHKIPINWQHQIMLNHVRTALQKWALVTQEKTASPLDFNTSYSLLLERRLTRCTL